MVSWCVCAIHSSVQVASGHRLLDATSRSAAYYPPGDIGTVLVHSPRSIPNLPPAVPVLLPVLRPRFPSRYAVDAIAKPVVGLAILDERLRRQRSSKRSTIRTTADREKIVESSVKRGSRRERRKKCRCRKVGLSTPLLRNEAPILRGSFIIRSIFTSVRAASDLNPVSKLTAETSTHFTDIASTTADDAIAEAAKEADDAAPENHKWNFPRERCKKIGCVTKCCRKKGKINVIDVLVEEFFRDDLGNVGASRAETPSSSLENVDLQSIVD